MIMKDRLKKGLIICLMALSATTIFAQGEREIIDYSYPDEYVIGGITISGIKYLDQNALIGISGLRIGQKVMVPGDKISQAVEKLWNQGLFSDVEITVKSIEGINIYLDIYLQERPRLTTTVFTGLKNSETQDILEKVSLPNGSQVTAHVLNSTRKIIIDHFMEKGFLNTEVTIVEKDDPERPNNVILNIIVDKKEKVRIGEIKFMGNEYFKETKLRRIMKDTRQKSINIFKPSKFISSKYDDDKVKLVEFYNENGFRDFYVIARLNISHIGGSYWDGYIC